MTVGRLLQRVRCASVRVLPSLEAKHRNFRTKPVRRPAALDGRAPFLVHESVAQKMHFRCGANVGCTATRSAGIHAPEPHCDEVDYRDHQAFQAR
jgi:hypothetical protein